MPANVAAIIPAAGVGSRLATSSGEASVPKALRLLAGRSLVQRSIDALAPFVDQIVLVAPPIVSGEGVDIDIETLVVDSADASLVVVAGGATRQHSVCNALAAVDDSVGWVLVHDAARPLVPSAVVRRVLDALADGAECVVPVIAAPDSLRQVQAHGGNTPLPRDRVRLVQTPQGFTVAALRRGHDQAGDDQATDDATLVEAAGSTVVLVEGDPRAFKITTPLDLMFAETLLGPA